MADTTTRTDANGRRSRILTPHDERRAAVAAGCDPRTVRAYLEARPMRSTTAARVAEAMTTLGFDEAPEAVTTH